MNKKILSILCCIPLTFNICNLQNLFNGEFVKKEIEIKHYKSNMEKYMEIKKYLDYLKAKEEKEKAEKIRIEKEKKLAEENRKKQEKMKLLNFPKEKGLSLNYKKVTCHITYYTNEDSLLQGGQYDKIGKLLTSHNEPIAAAPSNIPYGSYLIFDEEVRGSKEYKIVDTGGAIKWIDNYTMKVDIFVPNVSTKWLCSGNVTNKVVTGILYYK